LILFLKFYLSFGGDGEEARQTLSWFGLVGFNQKGGGRGEVMYKQEKHKKPPEHKEWR